ncbi:MAG: DUF6265 family protein [Luteitalea sp.]
MRTHFVRFAVCSGALLFLIVSGLRAQEPISATPPPPARATIAQVAWIAGPWTGTLGDRTIEQHWMAPLGTSMVAMYRNVQGDRPMLYELLTLEQEGDGVVLRIKHFAPGAVLVGRQEKDQSVNHPLVRLAGQTAVFEGGLPGTPPARITFQRVDADHLTITVARMRDGAPTATEFKYARVPALP